MANKNKKLNAAQAAKVDAVVTAADGLLQSVLAVLRDPDFKSVFAIAANHNYVYNGPQLEQPIKALALALNDLRGAPEQPKQPDNVVPFDANATPASDAVVDVEAVPVTEPETKQ